jgi:hypothetical protein
MLLDQGGQLEREYCPFYALTSSVGPGGYQTEWATFLTEQIRRTRIYLIS